MGRRCCSASSRCPLPVVRWALETARRHGVVTMLNPAPVQDLPDDLPRPGGLPHAERGRGGGAGRHRGDGSRVGARGRRAAPRARGAGTVIVTLGEQGALVCDGRQALHFPAFPVDAVDTTAAGRRVQRRARGRPRRRRQLEQAIPLAGAAAALRAPPRRPGRAARRAPTSSASSNPSAAAERGQVSDADISAPRTPSTRTRMQTCPLQRAAGVDASPCSRPRDSRGRRRRRGRCGDTRSAARSSFTLARDQQHVHAGAEREDRRVLEPVVLGDGAHQQVVGDRRRPCSRACVRRSAADRVARQRGRVPRVEVRG